MGFRELIRNLRKGNHLKLRMTMFTLPTDLEAIAQCLREEGVRVTPYPPGTPELPLAKMARWRLHCSTSDGQFEATHIGDKLIIKKLKYMDEIGDDRDGKPRMIGYVGVETYVAINLADPDSFKQAATVMRNYAAAISRNS